MPSTTCPFCPLHCTDLHLTLAGAQITAFTPICVRAEQGYASALDALYSTDTRDALATAELSFLTGFNWLCAANQPLVLISPDVEQETAHAALHLARARSAALDVADGGSGVAFSLAVKTASLCSATLGELRSAIHPVGTVILFDIEPTASLPRFWEAIGAEKKVGAIEIDPPDRLTAVRGLRLALKEPDAHPGAPYSHELDLIRAAGSGVVVFPLDGWDAAGQGLTELLLWLDELNAVRTWFALPVSPQPNHVGVNELLLAEIGSPGGMRFQSGEAEFSPRVWSAGRLLRHGGADFVLLVGEPDPPTQRILSELERVKTVQIGSCPPGWHPDLWLPAAQPGLDAPGTMLRLDGVPVVLPAIVSGERPRAGDWLRRLIQEAAR